MVFKKVANKSDVPVGKGKQVKVGENAYALFNIDGKFYSIDGKCTHRGGPLGDGFVEGKVVECPWHGSKFDVTTGKNVGPPAKKDVSSYKVKVEGNDILIDI